MGTLTGAISQPGYQVLSNEFITLAGYGLVVTSGIPPLPLNPYMGFTFPVLLAVNGVSRLSGSGRKLYRDGSVVGVPYPDQFYEVVVIWSINAVGKDWLLQW